MVPCSKKLLLCFINQGLSSIFSIVFFVAQTYIFVKPKKDGSASFNNSTKCVTPPPPLIFVASITITIVINKFYFLMNYVAF